MLTQFVQQRPEDPFPRYGLAIELKNGGRLADAEQVFADLVRLFPDYTPAYLHAGGVLAALGKRDEAMAVYRAGIDACARRRPPDGKARGEIEAALAALEAGDDTDDEVQP